MSCLILLLLLPMAAAQAGLDPDALAPLAEGGRSVSIRLPETARRWRVDSGGMPYQYSIRGVAPRAAGARLTLRPAAVPFLGERSGDAAPRYTSGRALDQRRLEGGAHVYVNFAINCHDWLDPDLSAGAVLRAARMFAQRKLRAGGAFDG